MMRQDEIKCPHCSFTFTYLGASVYAERIMCNKCLDYMNIFTDKLGTLLVTCEKDYEVKKKRVSNGKKL